MVAAGFFSVFVNLPSHEENKEYQCEQENRKTNEDIFARNINETGEGQRNNETDK